MDKKVKKSKVYRFTMIFSDKERRQIMLLASNEGKCVAHYIKEQLKPMMSRLDGI